MYVRKLHNNTWNSTPVPWVFISYVDQWKSDSRVTARLQTFGFFECSMYTRTTGICEVLSVRIVTLCGFGISSNTKVKQIFIPSVPTFHPVLQTVTRRRYMRYQFVEGCPTFRQSMEGYNTNKKMSYFSESCVLRMIKHLRNSNAKQPWVRDTSKSFSFFLEQATCSLIA